jgi:hypothetical protein
MWRRGWDSNPRWTCAHAGFQDRCLKPLGHPSKFAVLELRISNLSRQPVRAQDLASTYPVRPQVSSPSRAAYFGVRMAGLSRGTTIFTSS